jgi:hypothetical protein
MLVTQDVPFGDNIVKLVSIYRKYFFHIHTISVFIIKSIIL